MSKRMTKEERRYAGMIADLGCICCRELGIYDTPANIHHIRHGMGMGQRNSHDMIIPLCWEHHQGKEGIHGNRKQFEIVFGTELELLEKVKRLVFDGQNN